jgi:hypothetical protein
MQQRRYPAGAGVPPGDAPIFRQASSSATTPGIDDLQSSSSSGLTATNVESNSMDPGTELYTLQPSL